MAIDNVADLTPRAQYVAAAAQDEFDFDFPIFEEEDLVVDVDGVTQALGTDYTVDGEGEDAGGSITFTTPFDGGEIVTIYRDIAIQRTSDYQQNGPWGSDETNAELNRITLILQQLESRIGRALRVPLTAEATDDEMTLSPLANWLGKYVTINASGLPEPAALSDTTMTQSTIGQLLYPQSAAELAAGVTPTNYFRPWGSILRYGADPTGTQFSTTAINNALKCNAHVFDDYEGKALYKIDDVLRFKFIGQRLTGRGFGEPAGSGATYGPRTTIKYDGAAGGKMLTTNPNNGSTHVGEVEVSHIYFDGNAKANKGFEVYDDTVTGGVWRVRAHRCMFTGVTQGSNPTDIYLGTGTFPDFAHDFEADGVFTYGSARGYHGKGSIYKLINCTALGHSSCGVKADSGSAWSLVGCVFSANDRDIDVTSAQNVSAHGCWFEASTNGIYRAGTSHALGLFGCYMHTSSAAKIIDIGSAAGEWEIRGEKLSAATSSTLITNVNPSGYSHYANPRVFTFDSGVEPIRIAGTQTTQQEAFAARLTTTSSNATGDGTAVDLNASAFTEEYDVQSKFAAASGIYTAGIAGRRQFDLEATIDNVGAAHSELELSLFVGTDQYIVFIGHAGNLRSAANFVKVQASIVVNVAAGAQCYMRVKVSGSTKTVGVSGGAAASPYYVTRFSGRVV